MGAYIDTDTATGKQHVTPTFTCCHCNTIHPLRDDAGQRLDTAMCGPCFKPVCAKCHADGRCRPFERRCEEFESKVRTSVERQQASDRLMKILTG